MSYKPYSLFSLIQEINHSVFLPHIQRPFVWSEDQMCRLFDSLMRDYPVQTFLFWKTKERINTREFMQCVRWDADLSKLYNREKTAEGVLKTFVLDGQQRLQTLYAIFAGSVAGDKDSEYREAFLNVTQGDEPLDGDLLFQLVFSKDPLPMPYYKIKSLIDRDARKNALDIADDINQKLDDLGILMDSQEIRDKRRKRVHRNIQQMKDLIHQDRFFWIEELDGTGVDFPYGRILEIFIRVNSGGTKLTAADLMFAIMKEGWDDVEANIEDITEQIKGTGLSFEKDFVLKCLLLANNYGAELSPDKFKPPKGDELIDTLRSTWDKSERAFSELIDFIRQQLGVYGDKVVRSYLAFIPLFDYVFHNPNLGPSDHVKMRAFYYKAQLFNWFSSKTDNILNYLHNRLGQNCPHGFPIVEVNRYFSETHNREVDFKADHLWNVRLRYIVLNMIYFERHGVSPFQVNMKDNEPHIDHMYPQSKLKKFSALDIAEINNIGNYRFVGARENLRKRAEDPDSYFMRLKNDGVDIEKHLLVSKYATNPTLLKMDIVTYQHFLQERLGEILKIAVQVVNSVDHD